MGFADRITTTTKAGAGAAAWLAYLGFTARPLGGDPWAQALLVFHALVLVPLALDVLVERRDDMGDRVKGLVRAQRLQFPAAMLLAAAFWLQPGWAALAAALPWMATTVLLAMVAVQRIVRDGAARPMHRLCGDAGLLFLAVGGVWMAVDRAGWLPVRSHGSLGTLLAGHFCATGFLLPLAAGWVLRQMPESRFAARGAVGVVLAVPAAAVGLAMTWLGAGPTIEAASGWALALSGMIVAILHVRLATDLKGALPARGLLALAGAALFFGLLLAGLHASRGLVAPVPWLGEPWLRTLFSSINAFGFGLAAVLSWRLVAMNADNASRIIRTGS